MNGFDIRLRKTLPGFDLDVGWRSGGGLTVLFGYSGAGKSLTLGMSVGLLRPDAGHVRIAGRTLYDSCARIDVPVRRRDLGYVSQNLALFPHMTLAQNIAYGLKGLSAEERRDRVAELATTFRVGELLDRRPNQVSGGQRQRAALARALARRPDALLLDEPLSALDAPIRRELCDVIARVPERFGIPVLMVTHDSSEAFELADTLVVYAGDGVVQYGRPREVIADPGTPSIRRLLHAGSRVVPFPTPAPVVVAPVRGAAS